MHGTSLCSKKGTPSRRCKRLKGVPSIVVIGSVQEVLQLLAAAGVAELAQRLGLDLADALARDVELLAHFLERAGAAVLDAEAQAAGPSPRGG